MSDFSVEGAELKLLLKFSRKGPIPFAYSPGAKVETDLFGLHRRKPPAVMAKVLRAEGESPKVAFGTLQMEGKVVSLRCEKVLPQLAKKVKKFLKLNKVTKNVRILDMDGNVVEEDIEDLPDDPEDDIAAAPGTDAETGAATGDDIDKQPGHDLKSLAARAKALQPQVAAVPNPAGDKLRQAFTTAIASLKAGDVEAAGKTLDTIDQILSRFGEKATKNEADLAGAENSSESKKADAAALKKLQEAVVQLAPRVKALPQNETSAALASQLRDVIGFVRDGDLEPAISGLRALQQGLKSAEASKTDTDTKDDPLDIWNAAKEITDNAISALQSKIRQFSDPDLERIAELGLNGITQGNQTALMKRLMEFRKVDAAARPKAATALQAQCSEYRDFLAGSDLVTLCEQNPFGISVNLRKHLGKALDEIDRAAAAA